MGLLQDGTCKRGAIGEQKSLHLVLHRNSLMNNSTVSFLIFSMNQTNHFQSEFLVRDTAGVELGNSIKIQK